MSTELSLGRARPAPVPSSELAAPARRVSPKVRSVIPMAIERPSRFANGKPVPPPTLRALATPLARSATQPGTNLRVLSLNIQVNGENGRLPGIIAIIRQAGADLVGLQECSKETAIEIARQLGYNVVQTGGDTPVLTPHPIEPPPPGRRGVVVSLPSGQRVLFMNLHLAHAPYQPFQLLGIPYANGAFLSTEAEAIAAALDARGADVNDAVSELRARGESLPAIAVGDFNQPSHLDWTEDAARIRRHPLRVRWPESLAFTNAGFSDAYRQLYPNEIANPGFTWTPLTSPNDPTDHHDRIDFVYYRGQSLTPTRARIIGESAATSDIVVQPYPTDHRGLLIDFTLPLQAGVAAAFQK
ncbi:MAG: endonuclease/exonuclease/phosphatase family protein [Myxococcota bacterium]|nr:endonuclease/exonuclease/phosphatase family protein [Myxococcota bacterium]